MKKCLKRNKDTKNQKYSKNHNHITCCSWNRVWTSFLPILGHFCSFTPFLTQKIKIFKKWKKKPRDIIILHTLRCLINIGIKINVGVRTFRQNFNHSFIIVWCKRTTSDKKKKYFLFFKITYVMKMSHDFFLN